MVDATGRSYKRLCSSASTRRPAASQVRLSARPVRRGPDDRPAHDRTEGPERVRHSYVVLRVDQQSCLAVHYGIRSPRRPPRQRLAGHAALASQVDVPKPSPANPPVGRRLTMQTHRRWRVPGHESRRSPKPRNCTSFSRPIARCTILEGRAPRPVTHDPPAHIRHLGPTAAAPAGRRRGPCTGPPAERWSHRRRATLTPFSACRHRHVDPRIDQGHAITRSARGHRQPARVGGSPHHPIGTGEREARGTAGLAPTSLAWTYWHRSESRADDAAGPLPGWPRCACSNTHPVAHAGPSDRRHVEAEDGERTGARSRACAHDPQRLPVVEGGGIRVAEGERSAQAS